MKPEYKSAIPYVLGAIFLGLCIWLYVANRSLRQANREEKQLREASEKREKRISHSMDSLLVSVSERDRADSVRAIRDSIREERHLTLSKKLKALNNSNIIELHEDYTTIKSLPVYDFLYLLTGYIDSAEAK